MTKPQLIEVALNTFGQDERFSKEILAKIKEVLEELLPEDTEKNEVSVLLKYAEYLYKGKWGAYEIFLGEEITPYVRMKIVEFLQHNQLNIIKAKEYIKWINEMSYNLFKRKMQVYDLYNQKIYDSYLSRRIEDTKTILVDKKKLNSKRILTVD